jgi:hypothetical protein
MDRVGHAGAIVAVETAWRSHVWSEDVQPQARGALVTLGKLYVTGLDANVPVGTFETDVPLGVRLLKAIASPDDDFTSASLARDLLLAFDDAKSCRGCGSTDARKTCIGCWDADRTKARYCSLV